MAMGGTLEDMQTAGDAVCDLVISSSGLAAAKVLKERFGIPYVVGLPFGEEYADALKSDIVRAAADKTDIVSCALRGEISDDCDTVVVGESVYAGSVARAFEMQTGRRARVIHTLDTSSELIARADCALVIADPLFKPIVSETAKFAPLPHEAFSGRCFRKSIPDLVDKKLKLEF